MAARQDQGLQIALIAFVFLFVVFAALSYLFYKSSSDAHQQIAELNNQLSSARTAASNQQNDKQLFLQMLGLGEFENAEDVQKTFDEDMQRFGGNFGEDNRSYRNILEYIYEENEKIAAREVAAKQQVKELKDRLLATEAEKDAQLTQFEQKMKDAQEDAAAQRNSFDQDRQQLERTKQELSENLNKQRANYEAQLAERNSTIEELTDKLGKSERAKDNLLAQVSKSADSFEVADGRVSWVNQNGTLWIDLGSADSLRRQITFKVYDAGDHDPVKSGEKGSIEVTRILGDHLAEARITEDDPRNPILTGDQVYSSVWHRGKKLRFALTGIIDIDGDDRSDLQLARDLIELNGGIVDAYLDEDGKVEGEITVNTRYLVLGGFPESTNQTKLRPGWQSMSEDAQTNGVETITLDKFLNQIGYAPDDRLVRLGTGARSADFPPDRDAGSVTSPTSGSSLFRQRSPHRPLTPPQ